MAQPPTYPPGPYGNPGVPSKSSKGLATAGLVLGIVAAVFALFCPPVGIILGLIGLPLAGISFAQQQSGSAVEDSKGMAIAGIVLNVIALILWFVVFLGLAGLGGLVGDFPA